MRGGHGGRISSGDADAQRAINQAAPRVPHLLRRIGELFLPHRAALILTAVLVMVGAGLSRRCRRCSPSARSTTGCSRRAGARMCRCSSRSSRSWCSIYVSSAALGVWQTWLTATVGNKVMGALRVQLFTPPAAMELGFFTRTKTGIIQSRLQNDVGGVASVLTNTVSSVLGNTVTVIAAFVAMLLLNWQLTVVAVILMPILVIAQRRVGQVRARIATKTQESLSAT